MAALTDANESGNPPILEARPGGPADRFAALWHGRHPAGAFFAALLTGFAALAGASILLGLLVTDVLTGPLAKPDESFVETLAHDRTSSLTSLSAVGTFLGGAPWLPIVVGVVAIVCAFKRKWLIAAFAVFVLTLESATYRVTSIVVPRERPSVHRLDDLPGDASYPSGHTAASIAVYVGLVLLLTSRIRRPAARYAAWALAVLLPICVALSRMYRGMHHPLDVAGGLCVGIGAIAVLLFACRTADAVARAPWRERQSVRRTRGRVQAAS
jgi:membrane-associated phospholipid phosphatase